jgi:hypothetical protein
MRRLGIEMSVAIAKKEELSPMSMLAAKLVEWRKAAIEGRAQVGVEEKWQYAEDAYNGEDEVTKGRKRVLKPASPNSGFIGPTKQKGWQRSTAFLNITRPYVDVAAARIADMISPDDDRNWELRPTPKREIEKVTEVLESAVDDESMGQLAELIEEELEKIDKSVRRAQKQIDDWLNESKWPAKLRQAIWDAARVGSGVIKGPVAVKNTAGKVNPGVKIVKVQNLFPDPYCGDDIHNGDYLFEREEISKRKLREKKSMSRQGWRADAIDECLKEGPKNSFAKQSKAFELWHFQGEVETEVLKDAGVPVPKAYSQTELVWANVTLCNDWIVRVVFSPSQGDFTYHVLCWQRRDGYWAGIGVAEQLETVQRGLNGAVRNLFDNSALTSLPQIVFWKGVLNPVNGRFELAPGKTWEVSTDDRPLSDVKNAIMTIEIPSRQAELMEVIALMRDVAQETTGLPLVIMGQASTGAVGSDQLQTNAATIVLRRLAKEIDDNVTVPLISAFYEWIREYRVLKVREAVVDARGSSVLVERDIQAQALIQMVQISKDPIYKLDPEKVAEEWMRSQKFDPKRVKLSEEKEKQMMAMLAQPDEKAQAAVESAKIRAEALTEQAAERSWSKLTEAELDARLKREEMAHEREMMNLKYKNELVKYAMERKIDLAAAARELAEVPVPSVSIAPSTPSAPVSPPTGAPPSPVSPAGAEGSIPEEQAEAPVEEAQEQATGGEAAESEALLAPAGTTF